ncbi:AT-rich interactive domain-containing protein 3 [Zea mays]|uniref:AT-rich interactive domain-containing protein 3 n=1 Tax=Zea mays TaxID=4577 RepID=A0A3L6D7M6_MAIZE|nr:AT-rich interactive domain-containing protein 3 [Zea mays]
MIPTPPPPSKEHTPRCGPPEPQVQDINFLVALLEYEKHKIETGEFQVASSALPDRFGSESQVGGSHVSGSGRARRESATRAMQGWHSQRLLGNGEIADPIIKVDDYSMVSFIPLDLRKESR